MNVEVGFTEDMDGIIVGAIDGLDVVKYDGLLVDGRIDGLKDGDIEVGFTDGMLVGVFVGETVG